jgi:hypothetical protein
MPTPRMRSGIRACCRLEKRAARHRAPSIDPALKPFTSETDSARSAKGTGLLQWSPSFFLVPDAIISTSSREQLAVATAAEETQTHATLNGKEGTGAFSLRVAK